MRKFIKDAREEDRELKIAGQRVQIIKRDEKRGDKLEFGTEVVVNKDGTIASLLGCFTRSFYIYICYAKSIGEMFSGKNSRRVKRKTS